MATVNKDFKIKNGLIVEGANGTINGYDILTKDQADQNYIIGLIGGSATSNATANAVVLRDGFANFAANVITANLSGNVTGNVTGTVSSIANHDTDDLGEGTSNLYFSNARAKSAAADLLTSANLTNITITGTGAGLTITAENGVADSNTDQLAEGTTNLYFSNARVRDAVGAGEGLQYNESTGVFTAHLGYGLEIANNAIRVDADVIATDLDISGAIDAHNVTSGVHGVTGNVVGTSDAQTISNKTLGSNLAAGGYQITNLGAPQNSTDAATKAYVDAVSEGLHIHASVVAATTGNISISNDLMVGDQIDGVTLAATNRVLVKNQNTASENGIYVVQSSGAAIRAADFDQPTEVDGGDFVFVTGGGQENTGWVQTSETVVTIGTDPIYFTQFSGAGTFLAGYGLYLDGNTFNANVNVLANLSYVANAISDHSALTTGIHGVTGNVVGTSDTQTLSNKTLGNNVVLGHDLDAVNTYKVINLEEPTSNQDAATKFYVDTAISGVGNTISGLDTDDIAEGNNLYFTNARVEAVIAYSDTDDLDEGTTNKYFTNARAEAAMVTPLTTGTQTNITVTYDAMSGTYNFVAENGVDDSTTDNLDEGTANLYFTNNRAVLALEAVVPNFTEVDLNDVATHVAATLAVPTASTVTAYDFAHATYRSGKFLVKAEAGSHTEISEVLLTLDTSNNVSITEYAMIGTNGNIFDVTADVSGADVRIRVTTANNNTDVTVVGTLIK